MSHSLDFDIRERLATYLANEISLDEFEDWFFSETWDVDKVDDLDLLNLVYGIKLRLAEFSHGDWTEDELRSLLRPFVEHYVMVPSRSQIQYGTSSVQVRTSITSLAVQTVGIRFSAVSV